MSEGLGILEVREFIFLKKDLTGQPLGIPLIVVLGKQRQADLCEFKVSLVYKANAKIVSTVTLLHKETL